jgi:ADP-ribosylglycohydrolase
MLRLTWTQPEDLLPHALVAAELDGIDVSAYRDQWVAAGGSPTPAVSGASPTPASPQLRERARELLVLLDGLGPDAGLLAREPSELPAILALASGAPGRPLVEATVAPSTDRMRGAWLGRAAGCLLGKPVEKIPREGIRAIAQATGNWPISSYFTAIGLPDDISSRYPWNRRSRQTSLLENIDGMPEDDDLNFPLIALDLLESVGREFTIDDVANSWLANLPGGRVFTAERIVYRNLLEGWEPNEAAIHGNPFTDWIGAQIRTDVYGWANPGRPVAAATLAHRDASLSHRRNGLYGALFVAAASSEALSASDVDSVLSCGLSVVPRQSRYARAIEFGADLAASALDDESALDRLHAEYGDLHWVHVLNNAALLAFALRRSAGDFERAISLAVAGGWDTDSVGATAGALTGALAGATALPAKWIEPLHGLLASSIPGHERSSFDDLAARTNALVEARS